MPAVLITLAALWLAVPADVELWELDRFPVKDCAARNRWDAADCYHELGREWERTPPHQIEQGRRLWSARREAYYLWDCWEALDMAADPFKEDGDRLRHLRRLRDLIGWDAYYRGEMPPPWPIDLMMIRE